MSDKSDKPIKTGATRPGINPALSLKHTMKIEKKYRKDLQGYRWGFDITIKGQRIRRYEWRKKQDAIDACASLFEKARARRYGMLQAKPTITIQNLLNKIEKDRELKATPRVLRVFREFATLVDPKTELLDLTKADWKKYVDALRDRECKPNTINRYMADISKVLNSAPERFPDLGEWRAPKALWFPESPGRDRLLSKKELSMILAALSAERQFGERMVSVKHRKTVFDLFRLMLLTGAREGEILHLKQSQVSWDWKTVRIESLKGGGLVRVVPLSESALEILRSRIDHGQKFFQGLNTWQLYGALERAATVSGVVYGDRVEGGWIIYDLRHVAATVMENAGLPYSAVSAILGHKRKDQTATYAHAQIETLRRAVDVLENHCRDIDGFFITGREFSRSVAIPQNQASR